VVVLVNELTQDTIVAGEEIVNVIRSVGEDNQTDSDDDDKSLSEALNVQLTPTASYLPHTSVWMRQAYRELCDDYRMVGE